jgi:hypothetical protein
MRSNGTWQWLADTHLQVGGRILSGFAAEAAIDGLFLLLREIEWRLDTFRTADVARRPAPARSSSALARSRC